MTVRVPKSPDSFDLRLELAGVSRREFVSFCSRLMAVAPFGLSLTNVLHAAEVAKA